MVQLPAIQASTARDDRSDLLRHAALEEYLQARGYDTVRIWGRSPPWS